MLGFHRAHEIVNDADNVYYYFTKLSLSVNLFKKIMQNNSIGGYLTDKATGKEEIYETP